MTPNTLAPDQPILLRDKPTPPEVAEQLRRYSGRDRATLEEQLKLRYFYGGQAVIATPTPDGLQVHAVGLSTPDEAYALRKRLRKQGHHTVLSLYPRPWGENDVEILTPTPIR